jgi:hypothetical protein
MAKATLSIMVFMIAGLLSMMIPATFASVLGTVTTSGDPNSPNSSPAKTMSASEFVSLVTQLNQQIISNLNQQASQLLQASGGGASSPSAGSSAGSSPGAGTPASPSTPSPSAPYTGWGGDSNTGGTTTPPPQPKQGNIGVTY